MEEKLYAGYYKVKVTPPLGLPVPGYFAKRTSDGILSDLYLRCTAFAQGEKKALVISTNTDRFLQRIQIVLKFGSSGMFPRLYHQYCNFSCLHIITSKK